MEHDKQQLENKTSNESNIELSKSLGEPIRNRLRTRIKKEYSVTEEGVKNDYSCKECHKKFQTKSGMKRHICRRSIEDMCFKGSCISKSGLQKKEKKECIITEETLESDYSCKQCKKKFVTERGMKGHVCRSSTEYICPKGFCMSKDKDCVSSKNARCYVCVNCDKHVTSSAKWHLCIDVDGGPYVCNKCLTRFQVLHTLKDHIYISHVKVAFCDACSQTFNNQSAKKHHICGRDFSCKICGKTFPNKAWFENHLSAHGDVKPFCCRTCSRSFKRKGDLIMHCRLSHNLELVVF